MIEKFPAPITNTTLDAPGLSGPERVIFEYLSGCILCTMEPGVDKATIFSMDSKGAVKNCN